MEQRQQNRLAMHRAVLAVLEANQNIWKGLPAFARAVDTLRATVSERENAAGVQSQPTTGNTKATTQQLQQAIKATLKLSGATAAYALEHHLPDVHAQMARSRSYLQGLPDNTLIATLGQMLKTIGEQLANLSDYGIKKTTLTAAENEVAKAKAMLPNTREQVSVRSAAGSGVKLSEGSGRDAIRRLDGLVRQFEEDAPDFVRAYAAARKIVDSGRSGSRPDADGPEVGG